MLKNELARIKKELKGDRVEHTSVPHKHQFPDELQLFTAYIILAVDKNENCLTGADANRIEPIAQIREFHGNEISKDAMARKRD